MPQSAASVPEDGLHALSRRKTVQEISHKIPNNFAQHPDTALAYVVYLTDGESRHARIDLAPGICRCR